MKMKILSEEKLYFTAVILNILIFALEIVGFVYSAKEVGWGIFLYYTEWSNVLLLLSSFFVLLSAYFNVRKGCGTNFPTHLFRLVANGAGTLTFLVVLFVLMPMYENPWRLLFSGSMLYHHLLCPVISIVSFLLFEKEESRHLTYKHIPFGMGLTFVYGIIFIALNAARIVEGPYPFLYVYKQPVWASVLWFIAIFGLSAGISALLCWGNKKIFDRGIIHG